MRINCGTIAGGGKSVFLIHVSDSRLQISPGSPKNIHVEWDNTYIYRRALCLYFWEDLQAWVRDGLAFEHFVTKCHTKLVLRLNLSH
jgi:hypothetical protein